MGLILWMATFLTSATDPLSGQAPASAPQARPAEPSLKQPCDGTTPRKPTLSLTPGNSAGATEGDTGLLQDNRKRSPAAARAQDGKYEAAASTGVARPLKQSHPCTRDGGPRVQAAGGQSPGRTLGLDLHNRQRQQRRREIRRRGKDEPQVPVPTEACEGAESRRQSPVVAGRSQRSGTPA